jgi:hypothetical protein
MQRVFYCLAGYDSSTHYRVILADHSTLNFGMNNCFMLKCVCCFASVKKLTRVVFTTLKKVACLNAGLQKFSAVDFDCCHFCYLI